MDNRYYLIFFLFTALMCCQHPDSNNENKPNSNIERENPKPSLIKAEISQIDTFLPIEDHKILSEDTISVGEKMFIKSVNRIVQTEDQYWIYSYSSSGIFVFNRLSKKGKQVAQRGKGPEGILMVSDLSYSPAHQNIFVVDPHLRKINKYNVNGQLEKNIQIDQEVREIEHWEEGKFFMREMSEKDVESQVQLGSFDAGFDSIKIAAHIPPHSEGFSSNALSSYNGEVYYSAMEDPSTCLTWKWNNERGKFDLSVELDLSDFKVESGEDKIKLILSSFWKVADSVLLWQFSDSGNSFYFYYDLEEENGRAFRSFSANGFTADIVGRNIDNQLLFTLNQRKSSFTDLLNWDGDYVPPSPMQTLYETDNPIILEVDLSSVLSDTSATD